MAIFARARETLGGLPQLSPTVEKVLQKCEEHVDLLLDTITRGMHKESPSVRFVRVKCIEQETTSWLGVLHRPLLLALQTDRAECGHCSPLGRLCIQGCSVLALQTDRAECSHCSPLGRLCIQGCSVSGSSIEGLMGLPRFGGIGGAVATRGSAVDVMVQLGPVRWAESTAGECPDIAERKDDFGAASLHVTDQEGTSTPCLTAVPTENPGFVLLLQEKEHGCRHQGRHCFTAESVRQLVYDYCTLTMDVTEELTPTGPATSFHTKSINVVEWDGYDIVPCLRVPRWPSDEFFNRRRTCDWPPASVRDDIRDFGIHLVPVGAKGSRTERLEWRLSFSRAEVVAVWHMTPEQLLSLVVSKSCKGRLGPEGKAVKSYYLKTTLLWLCQETPAEQWRSIMQGVMMMMDFLEKAISDRCLPCFFWTGINLLQKSSPDELDAMRRTVSLIRLHSGRLLADWLPPHLEARFGTKLLHHPAGRLSEDQVRTCLAAALVLSSVQVGISLVLEGELNLHMHGDYVIVLFLRSSAREEFGRYLREMGPYAQVQVGLFEALMVAPDDLAARCRLISRGDGLFSLDAAPLIELLTPSDLQMLLGDPAAVSAWLQRQRRLPPGQRPAGLPPDLNSPRARADLLLNPLLLARALRESVPALWQPMLCMMQKKFCVFPKSSEMYIPSFAAVKRMRLVGKSEGETASRLYRHLHMDRKTALERAACLREITERFLAESSTEDEYERVRTQIPDSWRLLQFAFAN